MNRCKCDVFIASLEPPKTNLLLQFAKNEKLCDIKVQLDNGYVIPAHKCILIQSPFIKREMKGDVLKLENVSECELRIVIEYLYTGIVNVNEENVIKYLKTAKKFELEKMNQLIYRQLDDLIHENNIISLLCDCENFGFTIARLHCINQLIKFIERDESIKKSAEYQKIPNSTKSIIEEGKILPILQNSELIHPRDPLIRHFKMLFNTKEFSDVTLISRDGKKFRAHKMILSSESEFFNTVFTCNFKDSNNAEYNLNEIDSRTLEHVLHHIYGIQNEWNELPNDTTILCDIIRVANYLMLSRLQFQGNHKLVSLLNKENCFQIFQFCVEYEMADLKQLLISQIVHSDEISLMEILESIFNKISETRESHHVDPHFKQIHELRNYFDVTVSKLSNQIVELQKQIKQRETQHAKEIKEYQQMIRNAINTLNKKRELEDKTDSMNKKQKI